MSHHNTAFHQILKPVSRHEFETLAKQHHAGQKLRSATRWDQFIGLIMFQLSGRQSLRDIESNLEAQQEKLYHLGAKPIANSTLSRLNNQQPAELYEALFHKLLKRCKTHSGSHKFCVKNPLYSLDASAINLSLKLFPWAAHRDDTANVKLSVGLNHSSMIPEFVALSDGNENDMIEGRKFEFPKGSIVAFDKGYVDYEWFADLTEQGVSFVTGLRAKAVHEVVQVNSVSKNSDVISDEIIRLSSAHAQKRGVPLLRKVVFVDAGSGKVYQFLTNNFKLAPSTIAALYKGRWQVELFFKAIKQNLKIRTFLGQSRNAVLTQIWVAMIAYLLAAFARHSAKEGWTVQRIFRVLKVNLFERELLKDLLKPSPRPKEKDHPQMRMVL